MKRTGLLFIVGFLVAVIGVSAVSASERYPLGRSNFSLKLDYIEFTDNALKAIDTDSGTYFGIEGFANVSPRLYLGGEIGWTYADGRYQTTNTQIYYVPLEFNAKYAIEASPNFVIAAGGGISFNYAEARVSPIGLVWGYSNAWLFGGQLFLDLNYVADGWFIGVNGKYQTTEDFKSTDVDFNNWRVGIQIGGMY